MSDEERISRERLLKRAAAIAGAVYAAPVLTSSAGAATEGGCQGKCHNDRRCQRRGGKNCKCVHGTCQKVGDVCQCTRQDPNDCSPLEQCDGNCACFRDANSNFPDGWCIDLRSGFCADFTPCDAGKCPAGQVCIASCCPEPICVDCCVSAAAPAGRSAGGAGSLYLAD